MVHPIVHDPPFDHRMEGRSNMCFIFVPAPAEWPFWDFVFSSVCFTLESTEVIDFYHTQWESHTWKCCLFFELWIRNIYTFLGFLCNEVLNNPQLDVGFCREVNISSCSFKEWRLYWVLRKLIIQKYLSLLPFTLFFIRTVSLHDYGACVHVCVHLFSSQRSFHYLGQVKCSVTSEQRS